MADSPEKLRIKPASNFRLDQSRTSDTPNFDREQYY